jgi:serine/threonine protein phosphatase PrpC
MLARLRGMVQTLKRGEPALEERQELPPSLDEAKAAGDRLPLLEKPVAACGSSEPPALATGLPDSCPHCGSKRLDDQPHCTDCGWIFPLSMAVAAREDGERRIKNRYELSERLGERRGVARYRGLDCGDGNSPPVPVIVLRQSIPEPVASVPKPFAEPDKGAEQGERLPDAGQAPALLPMAEAVAVPPAWPSVAWELALLEQVRRPVLPAVIDHFVEEGFEYLVEELPTGQSLWDAWDDPTNTADQQFGWLKQIAGALHHLHQHQVILEALRPDIVVVTPEGQPRLTDLSDLLPLPLPSNPPIRATCYTAPELVLASDTADARTDLYGFGAMLYALQLGRELTELDFEMQGVPKSILQRFPDIHPLFGRLVSKTFCRDLASRFPTEELAKEDPSGFVELINTLQTCRQTLDLVRLEIAAWTTTGMVRGGNEDAFALLHSAEARQDDLRDAALVLLADGMGGYEAGEVAAALAVQAMRRHLLQQKPFAVMAGDPTDFTDDCGQGVGRSRPLDVETCEQLIAAVMKDANRQVYEAAQAGIGRRGMGCTAEVVYADGRHVVVGHVGDSRTYHLHEGRLSQLTRDQTLVNRMVEIGALTPEEAEQHPRRCELQQAIGGHPDVEPALHHRRLRPGDWLVVCSDGLSNHIRADTLQELLQAAASAESAARRLVNLANLQGATDNATVVVIRVT